MFFQTTAFGIFLVVVLALYWGVANRRAARYWVLLLASYYFYGSYEFWYLSLIFFSTALDYQCGRRIHDAPTPAGRKRWLWISLIGNLGVLGFFKYTDWALESLQWLGSLAGADLGLTELKLRLLPEALFMPGTASILVPVGISFYTFQTLSYTIDIYRGNLKPARNLQEFALFVAFFPQLVAGPIVRAVDFLPQLDRLPRLDRERLHDGLYRLGQGIAKKVILADVLGRYLVDPVFADPGQFTVVAHLLCMYGFALQIYYDFSGYSDCAIGAAKLLGFDLPENFIFPYKSQGLREFWRRWHISLSSWVRDYVFFPLGGSRGKELIVVRNLMLTMLIIAIWHGASMLWVYYGLCQGGAMAVERWLERRRGGEPYPTTPRRRFIAWFLTFHFIVFTCIFIRSETHAKMVQILTDFGDTMIWSQWGMLALAASLLTHGPSKSVHKRFGAAVRALPTPVLGLLLGIIAGAVAIVTVGETPFIYFAF